MNNLKQKWENLSPAEKQNYLSKAAYLVDQKYVLGKTTEELAKEMFLKENR